MKDLHVTIWPGVTVICDSECSNAVFAETREKLGLETDELLLYDWFQCAEQIHDVRGVKKFGRATDNPRFREENLNLELECLSPADRDAFENGALKYAQCLDGFITNSLNQQSEPLCEEAKSFESRMGDFSEGCIRFTAKYDDYWQFDSIMDLFENMKECILDLQVRPSQDGCYILSLESPEGVKRNWSEDIPADKRAPAIMFLLNKIDAVVHKLKEMPFGASYDGFRLVSATLREPYESASCDDNGVRWVMTEKLIGCLEFDFDCSF